jgi:AAA domain, putative AbiEii toxin, Type IV TA system
MISQFEIKNFRCYRQWHQSGLKRFNFIVGESGTGKTALLESLFMVGASNPEIWFRVRRWRGIGEGSAQITTRDSYESLFRDLFNQYDIASTASVRIWDTDFGKRELEIFFENQDVYTLPLRDDVEERQNAFAMNPVVFKWDLKNHVYRTTVEIVNGALQLRGKAEVYPIILISTRGHSPKEYAGYYSSLSRTRKAAPVLEALQEIFPEIKSISLELVAGEPLLHVDVKGLDQLIALGDLSGGLDRYLSIVVAILMNRGGAILIDEIETGFYYKNLPALLRSIVSLCDKNNVQLFATTHSYEFLKVMTDAMSSARRGPEDFCVLRLEKEPGHQPLVTLIEGSSYKSAIESEFEIR